MKGCAVEALFSQLPPTFGEIEKYLLILGIGAFLGPLITLDGPLPTVFGIVGRRLGSHLSYLFKREHRVSQPPTLEVDVSDADQL